MFHLEATDEFRLSGAMMRGERLRHAPFGCFVMNCLCWFCVLATLLLACQPALAEKRVALVIGNSNYKSAATLPNPANDAAALAQTLKGAGFDVVESRLDLQAAEMRRALRDFADQARDSDIAVIYYAGHGIEIDGTNYLLPTDARLERDTDIYDEGFSLDRILLAIEPARLLRLVIVDACRNNPFADAMKRTVASRSVGRGLARVEPVTTNTLVAFAAKAGFTALDGASRNSPYATALVKYIAKPGLDLRKAFGFIRDDVLQATGSRQEPYVYGSLGGADVALVPAGPVASMPAADASQSDVRRDLELALQFGNKDALNAFLAQHPDGYYANLARLQLAKIAERTAVAATEKTGFAAEDPKPAMPAQFAEPERRQLATHRPADDSAPENKLASTDAPADGPLPGPSTADGKQGLRLASLNDGAPPTDLVKSVQAELRRVGCLAAAADGEWDKPSQRSMALFNKHAGTNLDVKLASLEALDAIKLKPARVCPLTCEHGFKPDGDQCSRIVCAEGSFVNEGNECEKRRVGVKAGARHDHDDRRAGGASRRTFYGVPLDALPSRIPGYDTGFVVPPYLPIAPRPAQAQGSQGSGQIYCDDHSCRAVRPGCHIESLGIGAPRASSGLGEVCR
jgi:Caspase domain